MPDDRIEVIGVDHIYLTVSDMDRAERFYDTVLGLLDFRKATARSPARRIGTISTR